MRGLVSKRKFLIGAAALLFLFSLNFFSSQTRNFAVSAAAPLQAFLWQAGSDISLFLGGGTLRAEYEILRQENLALLARVVDLEDTERDNEELREMLGLGLAQEFKMEMVEVIGKDLTRDVVTIRGGQTRGIQKGMPVITSSKVAVGVVAESFPEYARVELISSRGNAVDAQAAETEATGVLRGQGGQKVLFELIPRETELFVGDIVITSSLGGVFPKNLLLGEITEVSRAGADFYQQANVQPFFSIKSLQRLFVIISSHP